MRHVLVIAGLDPSAGAGLLADVRVVAEHGLRAVGVATCLTVQDTSGLRAVEPVSSELLADQLRALLADVEVQAVKIGALGSEKNADVVTEALSMTSAPAVWDPVLLPSRGRVPLLQGDPIHARNSLLTEVRVVTPNLDEARTLGGVTDPVEAARALLARGAVAVLLKGGHATGPESVDTLFDGDEVHELRAPRLDIGALHGSGCVLSSAIACGLANGASLLDAARNAKHYVSKRIASSFAPGRGARTLV